MVGGITRYEKPYFSHLWIITAHSPAYIEIYTVNDKFLMVFIFYKIKKYAWGLPPSCRNHGNNNCTVQKVQNRTAVLKHMLIYTFNAILQ